MSKRICKECKQGLCHCLTEEQPTNNKSFHYTQGINRYKSNQAANELDREVQNLLRPLFDQYIEKGYAPHDIAYQMMGSIWDLDLQYRAFGWVQRTEEVK